MRVAIMVAGVLFLLAGCLTAEPGPGGGGPADGADEVGADGIDTEVEESETDPGPPVTPTCGMALDMAFVAGFEAPAFAGSPVTLELDGIALFINRTEQPLDLSSATVTGIAIDQPDVSASGAIEDASDGLPAGHAHGSVPSELTQLVQASVTENWSSDLAHRLSFTLEHTLGGGTYSVNVQVDVGELFFLMPIVVEIIPPPEDGEDNGRLGAWQAVALDRITGACPQPIEPPA